MHVDPPCPLPAINGGYCPGAGGERPPWSEVILPADAPAPARLASGMGFPTSWWRRRHAAPPSHPLPCTTVVFTAQVVIARLLSSTPAAVSLDRSSASSPEAAGMQVCTPTHPLHLSVGWRIAPPPCPTGANLPDFRLPQPPRACAVPLWHPDARSSVTAPPALRRKVICRVTLALLGLRRST